MKASSPDLFRVALCSKSAFHRIASIPTPPELVLRNNNNSEEDDDTSSWSSSSSPTGCSDCESPTCFGTACRGNMLAMIRKRLALARQRSTSSITHPPRQRPRLYHPQKRRVTRIKVPLRQPAQAPHPKPQPPSRQQREQITASRFNKAPCQACREPADGCMRKAFDWPFETLDVFYDKGRPFVYLCNKCGLRYNKSSGCVCRHCRWVLCKEEKRKAMQQITYMRKTQDHVGPDDLIYKFVCSPKYWMCGQPWRVGWVWKDGDDDNDDDDDDDGSTPTM